MRVDKGGLTVEYIDVVAVEFSPGGVGLRLDDRRLVAKKILDSQAMLLDRTLNPGERALFETGYKQHRFSQRLARECSGVCAEPAELYPTFDDGDPFIEFRRLDCGFFARRPRANNNQVVILRCVW